jgi:hypothetical protein
MKRGWVAAVLVANAGGVGPVAAPVLAAPVPDHVVYEVYRAKPGGPAQVPVQIRYGAAGVIRLVTLTPDEDEGGYRLQSYRGTESSGRDGQQVWTFEPAPGTRHVVVVPRRKTTVVSLSGFWRVRRTTLGFRTVTAEQADADARTVAGMPYEEFRSASAPSGRYGSMATAYVPCEGGIGQWTLGTDGEPARGESCYLFAASRTLQAKEAGRWTLRGPVYGRHYSPFRLMVLDFPKR